MLSEAAQWMFWACVTLVLYVYAGYPLLLAVGAFGRRRRPLRPAPYFPRLSVLIPAYDEETVIAQKIANVLASDYPRDLLEVLVGDDASCDRTAAIVRGFAGDTVRLISSPHRRGKSGMQNELAARASGALLVFTDADCFCPPAALRLLAENFADPAVGLATNSPRFSNADDTGVVRAEDLYWRYERWLRRQESDRGLLAVASGSLFALRRELWTPLEANEGDDLVLPLRVALLGRRNLVDARVSACTELTEKQPAALLHMKVRIVSKDLRGLLRHRAVLNPWRTAALAPALASHKLLRWLVPYFLLLLLASSLLLIERPLYAVGFFLQAAFYALALAGFLCRGRRAGIPFSAALTFCVVNSAALLGTLHCAGGRTAGQWRTVR